MKENVVVEKSKAFAVRIIQLYKYMYENKKEFQLYIETPILKSTN